MSSRKFRYNVEGGVYVWYTIQEKHWWGWKTLAKFLYSNNAKLALQVLRQEEKRSNEQT